MPHPTAACQARKTVAAKNRSNFSNFPFTPSPTFGRSQAPSHRLATGYILVTAGTLS